MNLAHDIKKAGAALTADNLGDAKARLKVLKKDIADLENVLITHALTHDVERIDGYHYTVVVSRFTRSTTAWKKIAMDLGASAIRIAKNTARAAITKVTCTAHKEA